MKFCVGCEAVIDGPLKHTSEQPLSSLFTSQPLPLFDTKLTHPAVVRCWVTCLNQQGTYRPAMALIVTSQGRLIEIDQSVMISSDGHSKSSIVTGNVSNCEPQNNYTMEFEYFIYSNDSNLIDRAVVVCGVQVVDQNTSSSHICLGQSYGIIQYYESAPITTPATNTQSNTAEPSLAGNSGQSALQFWWLVIIIISIAIIVIVVLLNSVGFFFISSRSRASGRGITKSDLQTEKQASGLVIKVEHDQLSEDVKEKETLMDENTSNRSPVQAQLDQKLPDVISSRI